LCSPNARPWWCSRAERGGTIHHNGEARDFAAIEAEQIDPTGAGDIFAAVLHSALDRLDDLDRAITVAAYLAGRSITRVGFDSAPLPDEIRAAWRLVGVEPVEEGDP
jgi:sugar/nucleoside kinase (ribokinase family)